MKLIKINPHKLEMDKIEQAIEVLENEGTVVLSGVVFYKYGKVREKDPEGAASVWLQISCKTIIFRAGVALAGISGYNMRSNP